MKFEDWLLNITSPSDAQFEKQWRNKYCTWAEYMVDSDVLLLESNSKINNWCDKNLIGRCTVYHSEVYFEFEEDSVMFALRWC